MEKGQATERRNQASIYEENHLLQEEIKQYRQHVDILHQQVSLLRARNQGLVTRQRHSVSVSGKEDLNDADDGGDNEKSMNFQSAQIKLLKGAFESEQRDRKKIELKLTTLEPAYAFMKERLNEFQLRQHNELLESRQKALEKYEREYFDCTGQMYTNDDDDDTNNNGKGESSLMPNVTNDEEGYDEIDEAFPYFLPSSSSSPLPHLLSKEEKKSY
jgi:hypothetical protein